MAEEEEKKTRRRKGESKSSSTGNKKRSSSSSEQVDSSLSSSTTSRSTQASTSSSTRFSMSLDDAPTTSRPRKGDGNRSSSKKRSSSSRRDRGSDGLPSSQVSRGSASSVRSQSSSRRSSRSQRSTTSTRSTSSRYLEESDWHELIATVRPEIEKSRRRTSSKNGMAEDAATAIDEVAKEVQASLQRKQMELNKQSAYKIIKQYGQAQIALKKLETELSDTKAELAQYKTATNKDSGAKPGSQEGPAAARLPLGPGAHVEELRRAREEIKTLKADLQVAKGKVRDLKLQNWKHESEIKDLQEQVERAYEENDRLKEDVKRLKTEASGSASRASEPRSRDSEFEQQPGDSRGNEKKVACASDLDDVEKIQTELATSKQRVTDLTNQVLDLKQQLAQHELQAQSNPLLSFLEKSMTGTPAQTESKPLKNENWKMVKKSISQVAHDGDALRAAASADSDDDSECDDSGWDNVRASIVPKQQQGNGWDMLFSALQPPPDALSQERMLEAAAAKGHPRQANFMSMFSVG